MISHIWDVNRWKIKLTLTFIFNHQTSTEASDKTLISNLFCIWNWCRHHLVIGADIELHFFENEFLVPSCVKDEQTFYFWTRIWGLMTMRYNKYTYQTQNIAKSLLPVTCYSIVNPFWNLVQNPAISLPCCVQNLNTFWQLKWMFWVKGISRNVSLNWLSNRYRTR